MIKREDFTGGVNYEGDGPNDERNDQNIFIHRSIE